MYFNQQTHGHILIHEFNFVEQSVVHFTHSNTVQIVYTLLVMANYCFAFLPATFTPYNIQVIAQ